MSVSARISREYLLQIGAFAVAALDRLLLPALLLREMGVSAFAGWTVAIALAAFMPVLDFGLLRYASNRLLALRARGEVAEAVALYRKGSIALAVMVLLAMALLMGWATFVPPRSGDATVDAILPAVLVPVILAIGASMLIALRQALYRAHQLFARETVMRTGAELLRVLGLSAAALAGFDLIGLAWLWFALVLTGAVLPFVIDSRRKFPEFTLGWQRIDAGDVGDAAPVAPGYWMHAMGTSLFATLPILALGAIAASPAVVAQFALMRTIANLVRQVLQMFANVFGLECARRLAMKDGEGFASVFGEANRFLAVQASVVAVALLVLGEDLFGLWTGEAQFFDPMMLALAILPPILMPTMMLSTEALAYAERPWVVVWCRLAQFVVTVVLFLLLPFDNVGLKMMAALAAAEVFAFGLPLMFAMRGLEPRLGLLRQSGTAVLSLLTLGAAGLIFLPLALVREDAWTVRLAVGLGLGVVAFVILVPLLGFGAERRRTLWGSFRLRLRR